MRKLIFTWLSCIIAITACAILCHTTMKQAVYFHTYDDSYALLEQAIQTLNDGKKINTITDEVILEQTKQCFIVVFDEKYAISYTNATFNEQPLTIPLTLARYDSYHEDIYTPNETLRFATVSCAYNGGHVVVGQTMEKYDTMYATYTDQLLYMYGVLCLVIFPLLFIFHLLTKENK